MRSIGANRNANLFLIRVRSHLVNGLTDRRLYIPGLQVGLSLHVPARTKIKHRVDQARQSHHAVLHSREQVRLTSVERSKPLINKQPAIA